MLTSGNLGVFPLTLKQAHRFKSAQRTVERPERRQKTATLLLAETFREFVAVEFGRAAAPQMGRAHADGGFKRDQLTGFPSHRPTIRRYMLIVNIGGGRSSIGQSRQFRERQRQSQQSVVNVPLERLTFMDLAGVRPVTPSAAAGAQLLRRAVSLWDAFVQGDVVKVYRCLGPC